MGRPNGHPEPQLLQRRQRLKLGGLARRNDHVHEPGFGKGAAGKEIGLTGRHLAPKLVGFYRNLHNWFDGWPVLGQLFGRAGAGRTFLTAGLILSVMITPIITSIAREVIETTPQTDRDGALALGATRWEMIKGAVLPHSMGGIIAGLAVMYLTALLV